LQYLQTGLSFRNSPKFGCHALCTKDQVVLKNTFLTVESVGQHVLRSHALWRSKSLDSCKRSAFSSEMLSGVSSNAVGNQIQRLNRLRCLNKHELLERTRSVENNVPVFPMEHDHSWQTTFNIDKQPTCETQKLCCAPQGSETCGLLKAPSSESCSIAMDVLPSCKLDTAVMPSKRTSSVEGECYQQDSTQSEFTTAMIRNIPYHYTQEQLMRELANLGFTSMCYDFLYLPSCKGKRSNVGYAFINCKGPQFFPFLKQVLRKYKFEGLTGSCRKLPSVSPAACQGFVNNINRLSQRCFNEDVGRPLIFGADGMLFDAKLRS